MSCWKYHSVCFMWIISSAFFALCTCPVFFILVLFLFLCFVLLLSHLCLAYCCAVLIDRDTVAASDTVRNTIRRLIGAVYCHWISSYQWRITKERGHWLPKLHWGQVHSERKTWCASPRINSNVKHKFNWQTCPFLFWRKAQSVSPSGLFNSSSYVLISVLGVVNEIACINCSRCYDNAPGIPHTCCSVRTISTFTYHMAISYWLFISVPIFVRSRRRLHR